MYVTKAQTIDLKGSLTMFFGLKSGTSGSAIYSVSTAVVFAME